jgi:F-type H+-transporting ATPase subunit b
LNVTRNVTRAAAVLVWAGAWLLVASPAGASEESVGSCMVETIEELGGVEAVESAIVAGEAADAPEAATTGLEDVESSLEDCLEAPNPILPELNEIIWGGLAFLVLLAVMVRYGFPLVNSNIQARAEKIRSDLEAAETARFEAQQVKQQHEAELAQTRAEVSRIIDEARQEASVVKADLQVRAEAEIAEMRQRANAEVAAARQRALSDLQSDVAEIVVGAAERVVERNLDLETQRQLIDQYIASVGSR